MKITGVTTDTTL